MKLNKDVTICFRTNSKVQTALRTAAESQHLNVSALLNALLDEYLKPAAGDEKRRHFRKKASIPVTIHSKSASGELQLSGTIQDVSLSGVRIAIRDLDRTTLAHAQASLFEIVFRLSDGVAQPMSMTCKPARMNRVGGDVHIGAAFQDGDLQSYFKIQNFLM